METKIAANKVNSKNNMELIYRIGLLSAIVLIWHYSALNLGSELLLPMPKMVMEGFFSCLVDPEILSGLLITLARVLKGFFWALAFGLPLGFIMGFSKTAENVLSPLIDSIRQVPIMAWVPLTIVWFGIGDGPTIFLIAFSGVFPIILNTIHGVKAISKDYYNAARSMGASPFIIFKDVILPASMPHILTGSRLAIGSGWMSVI